MRRSVQKAETTNFVTFSRRGRLGQLHHSMHQLCPEIWGLREVLNPKRPTSCATRLAHDVLYPETTIPNSMKRRGICECRITSID
jgi:hypothetical protein